MNTHILGVDAAANDANVGLASAICDGRSTTVNRVVVCSAKRRPSEVLSKWISEASGRVLIAIDGPLGWPVGMGRRLQGHQAGEPLTVPPNRLFRRETDRAIQTRLGKTPLDVGADRIARTAHAALRLLGELGGRLPDPIPLAWAPDFAGAAAIEVYPAATLAVRDWPSTGYKKPGQLDKRQQIVKSLANEIQLDEVKSQLEHNANALDAVVCVLAGVDFVVGAAPGPEDVDLARSEGWIWVADKGRLDTRSI